MDHKTLTEQIAVKLEIAREDVGIMLHALAESIEYCALEGDSVTVPGFGTFETKKRLERIATHPSTGKRMLYPPKLILSFRPSSLLRKQLRDEDVYPEVES